ncbi:histidine kinase dimerization/phospho-acceptor domain-containing protein [Dactylosporangium sp. NPDC000555]|uniref:sensor histidine kinase n=1 Tax=Dactylosporangium sp. NPDC000555 TaxID=3154260 RepID=UPI00332346ED
MPAAPRPPGSPPRPVAARADAPTPEAPRLRTEFIRIAAHELRTPLTVIRGYSDVLASGRAGPMSEQQQRMVALIDLCAGRVYGVVEDLIVLSGLDDGSFGLAPRPTVLAPLAARAAGELATPARAAGVTIDVAVPEAVGLHADPHHLRRALSNLLSAAIGFAPRRGTVRLAADPCAEGGVRVVIACPDGGTPAAEQRAAYERCFGPGPGLNPGVAELEGVGLALAVAGVVVRRHGGTLDVVAQDAGIAVTVTLPPAPPPDPAHVLLRRRGAIRT